MFILRLTSAVLSCSVVVADMLSKVLFCCGCDGCCCNGGGATGSDNDRRSAVADGVLLTG